MPPAVDALLERRIVFVTGKGGTGKSTLAAALVQLAAERGRSVLAVDTDPKGDLARLLGVPGAGFRPERAARGASVMALRPEESLQEYLRIYFKVPRLVRLTPLARVFDFVANGIPGTREMLVVGKIAYEERRRQSGRPVWDLVVVDAAATGSVLPQLHAARSMLELVRGGVMRSQVEWVDETLSDPARTALAICALPEEMPVVEALELHDRARAETGVKPALCFLNRCFPSPVARGDEEAVHELGVPAALVEGVAVGRWLTNQTAHHARALREGLPIPVVEVPLEVAPHSGRALVRAVAASLAA